MGVIGRVIGAIAGNGRVIADTVGMFRESPENAASREAQMRGDALAQFAAEFQLRPRGWFDRLMDGMNRVPRPAMALGTLGLFVAAMVDPVWFSARMEGMALVPEPLWWLLGAIVSFYFGARHQAKGQEFRRALIETTTLQETMVARKAAPPADPSPASDIGSDNPALRDWRRGHGV